MNVLASKPLTKAASCNRACAKSVSARSVKVSATTKNVEQISRRETITAVTAMGALFMSSPAHAFLGIGDEDTTQKKYEETTGNILAMVKVAIDLPKNDPTKEEVVLALRKEINTWVATYRREPKVSGRPSYGNTYAALNALAGHYNSFGLTAPIPKKRMERLQKELTDATLLLSRGR